MQIGNEREKNGIVVRRHIASSFKKFFVQCTKSVVLNFSGFMAPLLHLKTDINLFLGTFTNQICFK